MGLACLDRGRARLRTTQECINTESFGLRRCAESPAGSRVKAPCSGREGSSSCRAWPALHLGWSLISQKSGHSQCPHKAPWGRTSMAFRLWIWPQELRELPGSLHLGLNLCFLDHLTWNLFWIFKGSCFLEGGWIFLPEAHPFLSQVWEQQCPGSGSGVGCMTGLRQG